MTMRSTPGTRAGVVLSMSLAAACAAQPGRYTIDPIPAWPGSNDLKIIAGINDSGRVVGAQYFQSGSTFTPRAYQWDSAGLTELPPTGPGSYTVAQGINNAGLVVGFVTTPGAGSAAAVLGIGGPTVIGTLGGNSGIAVDVNASGLIVGTSKTASGETRAFRFLWPTGPMTDLGTLGGTATEAFAVNDHGLIVGRGKDAAGVYRAFIATPTSPPVALNSVIPPMSGWNLTSATDINASGVIVGEGTLNGEFASYVYDAASGNPPVPVAPLATRNRSHVLAINASGVIVGFCTMADPLGGEYAFTSTVWVGGVARALTPSVVGHSGPTIEFASAINDSGQIVVKYPLARLTPVCPADVDADGFVTGDDFDAYMTEFELGTSVADFNNDGFVTADDFDAYTAAFEGGC